MRDTPRLCPRGRCDAQHPFQHHHRRCGGRCRSARAFDGLTLVFFHVSLSRVCNEGPQPVRHSGPEPESSRRASARRNDSFSPRTWAGWIPAQGRNDG
ncbi:hypothetical protein YA62_002095 [Agrobacterium sp. LC34]|nr:hypothetical protein CFBP6623_02610 [Agrobacterium tumefaciens]TKT67612.1 hypothetical protein YA62_002095 [Agrobacterium sp. LC34]